MNLYDLTNDFLQLQAMLEDPDVDTQAINDTLEALDYAIEDKADGYAKVIKNLESNLTAIKAEMERLTERKNLLESNIKKAERKSTKIHDCNWKNKIQDSTVQLRDPEEWWQDSSDLGCQRHI